jgi:hypothetical protein
MDDLEARVFNRFADSTWVYWLFANEGVARC